ncbi:MAG: hypothetical protein ABS93_00535 [Thiobacillus sp. SCN 62-729]|nr:MAG: hypothetical protein ABS93_00535 [Thiobacillus sp. SCN 62-729]
MIWRRIIYGAITGNPLTATMLSMIILICVHHCEDDISIKKNLFEKLKMRQRLMVLNWPCHGQHLNWPTIAIT